MAKKASTGLMTTVLPLSNGHRENEIVPNGREVLVAEMRTELNSAFQTTCRLIRQAMSLEVQTVSLDTIDAEVQEIAKILANLNLRFATAIPLQMTPLRRQAAICTERLISLYRQADPSRAEAEARAEVEELVRQVLPNSLRPGRSPAHAKP